MKSVYRLRAMVDETNREQWLAESKKWRDRAELEIKSYFRARNEAAPEDFRSEVAPATPLHFSPLIKLEG